jgi:hypothetical protein
VVIGSIPGGQATVGFGPSSTTEHNGVFVVGGQATIGASALFTTTEHPGGISPPQMLVSSKSRRSSLSVMIGRAFSDAGESYEMVELR